MEWFCRVEKEELQKASNEGENMISEFGIINVVYNTMDSTLMPVQLMWQWGSRKTLMEWSAWDMTWLYTFRSVRLIFAQMLLTVRWKFIHFIFVCCSFLDFDIGCCIFCYVICRYEISIYVHFGSRSLFRKVGYASIFAGHPEWIFSWGHLLLRLLRTKSIMWVMDI